MKNYLYDIAIFSGTYTTLTSFICAMAIIGIISLFYFNKRILAVAFCCSLVLFFYSMLSIPTKVHNALNDVSELKKSAPDFHYLVKFEKFIEKYDFVNAEKITGYLKDKASDKNVMILALLNNQLTTPINSISLLIKNKYVSEKEFLESLHQIRIKSNELDQNALLVINNLNVD